MTSKERHIARYYRRKAKRAAKKMRFAERHGNYDAVISQESLKAAFYKCRKGVRWKKSVQEFGIILPINVYKLHNQLKNETWKSLGMYEFDIIERGTPRHIQSVHISERCIQRSLCDNYLVPILSRSLIYDNGATLPGKGTDFAIRRFKVHLERYIRKHGVNGYIYFFDFKSYFANINNKILLERTKDKFSDKKLYNLYSYLVSNFGDTGLGLGSQISQVSAVFYPNVIDHFFKDFLRKKYYAHYMDDGYIICRTLEEVEEVRIYLKLLCDTFDITINFKKSHYTKLTKNFIFLKRRFFVTYNGKIIERCNKSFTTKERKRLRKFKKLLIEEKMTFDDILLSFHSWISSYIFKNNFYSILNMIKYFNNLFEEYGSYRTPKKSNRRNKVLDYMIRRAEFK